MWYRILIFLAYLSFLLSDIIVLSKLSNTGKLPPMVSGPIHSRVTAVELESYFAFFANTRKKFE